MQTKLTPQEVEQLLAERDQALADRDRALRERDEVRKAMVDAQVRSGLDMRDQRDEASEVLASQRRDFLALDQLKSKFYANMSHELRTPLNSIIGFTEDAIDGLAGEINPEQRRYLGNILNSSQHLLNVISEVLDLAKLHSGKVVTNPAPFALKSAFYELETMMHPLLLRKGQTLRLPEARELALVYADADKVLQILLNLVSNAHKYTPRGGHIVLKVQQLEGFMRVEVQDDGVGIAEADLPALFEEFTDVAKKQKWHEQGTGLGLAITKALVELQGGTIAVTSTPGKGSTFSFSLPLAAPEV